MNAVSIFRRMAGGFHLRIKLLALCFALIFVPLGLLTMLLYNNVGDMLEDQLKRSASLSFQQARSYLSFKLSQMITISDSIYFSAEAQDTLVKYGSGGSFDIYEQTDDMRKLDTFLSSFLSDDLYRASIYTPSNFIYSDQGVYIENYEAFKDTIAYGAMVRSRDKVLWMPNETLPNTLPLADPVSVISLYRKVRNQNQISELIGAIRLSIRQSVVDDIILNADISKQGVVFISNEDGVIVSRSSQANLDRFMPDKQKPGAGIDGQWMDYETSAGRYLIMNRPISGTDWTIVCAIPYKELMSQRWSILLMMVTLAGSIGAAAYLLSYLMSRSIMSRIHSLMEQMRRVHSDVRTESQDDDMSEAAESRVGRLHGELDQMISTFNFMLRRIDRLVEEKYQNGKEIKSAELRALQAQINPHFLYNTLDLINWKASERGAWEVVDIVKTLAQFYKLSLGRGSDIVALRYELDHIRAYVKIQNLRFDQGVELKICVDESFLEYRVPKIILQPLVENSILHGIMCKGDEPRGRVTITAHAVSDQLILTIADDGIGMSESALQFIMTDQSSRGSSYGVYNIDRRLKLYYGQEYGLHISLPEEGGVVVSLTMP